MVYKINREAAAKEAHAKAIAAAKANENKYFSQFGNVHNGYYISGHVNE